MSINLGNDLVKVFIEEVKHEFQEAGELREAARVKIVQGNKAQFPVLGKMQATERNLGSPLTTQNKAHNPVEVTVKNYNASAYTDIFQNNQTNFDDVQETAKSVSLALGRQMDQIMIDALDAATSTKTVADNVSGSADNLTLEALQTAAELLDQDGVPDSDRYALVHPSGLHHLLNDTQVSSSDFNSVKALVQGDLDTFYGFKFIKIGDRAEGGLPVPTSNHRTNFFYHRDALGCAVNMDIQVEINYVPEMGADLVSGFMSCGAKEIDPLGIVTVTTDES
jgi:hypothetical protein